MWSTSFRCLRLIDVLEAKKRPGFIYFNLTKYLSCFLIFIHVLNFGFAQDINSFANRDLNKIDYNFPSLSETIQVYPFYDLHNIKLNLTWKESLAVEEYNIVVHRYNSTEHDCGLALEHYKIGKKNTAIIPINVRHNTFLVSKCSYNIEIFPLPANNYNFTYSINYTIPVTSPVENIMAVSFEDEGKVKMNVTWVNPTEGLLPTRYNVKILRLDDKEYCVEHSEFQERDISANNTSVVLQEKGIIPGCSYKVEVVEQPANDLETPYINFTVPECVGKICSCGYKTLPAAPSINVQQISVDLIRILWTIFPSINVTNVTIVYFRLSLSQHSVPVIWKSRNITNKNLNKQNVEEIEIPGIITGALYNIHVWYGYNQYCNSSKAVLTFYARPMPESQWVYKVIIPMMFALMLICFFWMVWKRKFCFYIHNWVVCLLHRSQPSSNQPQIRRLYRNTTNSLQPRSYFAIPMEYNNLYREGLVDKYEISYNCLQIKQQIGGGAFGQVFLARVNAIAGISGYSTVAVKKLSENATTEELEEFRQEISMLKHIGQHANIVALLGYCTIQQPYCMIMEYVPCGDLLRYLRTLRVQYEQKGKAFLLTINKNFGVASSSTRGERTKSECSYITPESIPSQRLPSLTETEYTVISSDSMTQEQESSAIVPGVSIPMHDSVLLECVLDPKELQSFAVQIARGMEFLERKQIVHRDLAARNVLIDENKTLKISDFGLSRRGIYVNSKQKKVPLRWLSVEAIRDNVYTSKSDVWAYGIVLWEIGTLGGFPYPAVADHEILPFLVKGKRLEKPENCTDELYSLMIQCWSASEDQRPSFQDLVEYLNTIIHKQRVYVDFSQLNPSYVFPPTEEQSVTNIRTENNIQTIEFVLADSER